MMERVPVVSLFRWFQASVQCLWALDTLQLICGAILEPISLCSYLQLEKAIIIRIVFC